MASLASFHPLQKTTIRLFYMTTQVKRDIQLVQFTDCHLQAGPEQAYKGYFPEQRFDSVIAHIRHQSQQSDGFDHLIMSGDLAQFGASAVYQRLLEKTVGLAKNRHWLPGNHDDLSLMLHYDEMAEKVIKHGNWAIILLDSTSDPDGVGSGAISEEQLQFLAKADQIDVSYLLLVLHHPPITVNSRWQDEIKLSNSDDFWQVISALKKVKGISFGHLHQEQHIVRDDIELFCTPATTYQYKAEQDEVVVEDDDELAKAGYRLFSLHPDGVISTQVVRVS